MATTILPSIDPASNDDQAFPAFFPADMPVSYDASGTVVSRYGDRSWDLSSQSTDSTSAIMLYFYDAVDASSAGLAHCIREQQKALLWFHMDAGKARAPKSLRSSNYALTAWCEKAAQRGVDLFDLLSNPEWVTEGARGLNLHYVQQTPSLLRTLKRHHDHLSAPADLQLQALQATLNKEAKSRPEAQQTPLIPSRLYCAILATLDERVTLIEQELDILLDAYAQNQAASRNCPKNATKLQIKTFRAEVLSDVISAMKTLGYDPRTGATLDQFITGRLARHQLALMIEVAAFTGMRYGEVSILPLEDVLVEFEFMGSTHFELQGFTHKLHKGVTRSTSWITSYQGARAVRLAQRIARAIQKEHDSPPKAGQRTLLFPSTISPYKMVERSGVLQDRINEIREIICPVIEHADIEELDRLELARGWDRDDIVVGRRWPLAFHQLRRSLAVYAHRSGMVSLPALKAQLQHITEEMSAYYANGFSRAVNLVFDKKHFSHEWKVAKAESSYFAYAFGVMFSGEDPIGQGVARMTNTVESRSRADTLRLFQENKLAYQETPLGGCVSTEACTSGPLEPIPYDCLETNCVNMVVFGTRLEHVIKFQEVSVAALERDEAGSVEHRLEAKHLELLLKARDRLRKGAK